MTTRLAPHRTVRPAPVRAQPARPARGSVQAIARIRLAPHLSREVFEQSLRAIPAVRSAVHVIGDVDYELRIDCRDLAGLEDVLSSLRGCRGTEVESTALVLSEVEGLSRRAHPAADWGKVPRPRQHRSA
jgi:DNA-binding Lrp family transcriptional regulator